ncbi:MAG: GNAT family N-acetyltransferase [Lentisphaerae bacterium]|nr:GNAT family N-acetyltransferase [Lentisphaerota bacterium]
MVKIQNMKSSDWKEVSRLNTLAFNTYNQNIGSEPSVSYRSRANIEACLAMFPDGCFVAKENHLLGYIFSRYWGKHGWIGTFGVTPESQGKGVGKQLIQCAIESINKHKCESIGLETMPDSSYNVGMYAKLGFCPVSSTLILEKPTNFSVIPVSYEKLSLLPKEEALSAVYQLSHIAWNGLDYTLEVKNANEYKWGETLLCGWPQPWAIAIIRTFPVIEGVFKPICEVNAVVIHPNKSHLFPTVLQAIETFAKTQNISKISLPINSIYWAELQEALKYGFRVSRAMQRMILKQSNSYPLGIDLSKWLM